MRLMLWILRARRFCGGVILRWSWWTCIHPAFWAGWYHGPYTAYKGKAEEQRERVDRFLHVEWGGDSHAARHSEEVDRLLAKVVRGEPADPSTIDYNVTGGQSNAPKDGDWSETYACNLFDWHLKEQGTMPWLAGSAQWIFKDFASPLRRVNPVPFINQKGLLERDAQAFPAAGLHWLASLQPGENHLRAVA
jgi:beta-galactosidase